MNALDELIATLKDLKEPRQEAREELDKMLTEMSASKKLTKAERLKLWELLARGT